MPPARVARALLSLTPRLCARLAVSERVSLHVTAKAPIWPDKCRDHGLCLHVCSMHHEPLPRNVTLGGRLANAPLIYLCTCLVALLRCFGAHSAHNTCTEPCAEIDVGLDSRGWSGFGSAACRQYGGETALARQTETWLESLLPASSSVLPGAPFFICGGGGLRGHGFRCSPHLRSRWPGPFFFENMLMFYFNFLELFARHTPG